MRRCNVTSSLIGWAHKQNNPWCSCANFSWIGYEYNEMNSAISWELIIYHSKNHYICSTPAIPASNNPLFRLNCGLRLQREYIDDTSSYLRMVDFSIRDLKLWWRRDAIRRQHKSNSTLAQVMAWGLTASDHHLNQYWLIIEEFLRHSPGSNVTENTRDIYHWYEF